MARSSAPSTSPDLDPTCTRWIGSLPSSDRLCETAATGASSRPQSGQSRSHASWEEGTVELTICSPPPFRAAELLNSIPPQSRSLGQPHVDVDFPFSTSTPSRGGPLGRASSPTGGGGGGQGRPSLSTFSPSDFVHHQPPPLAHTLPLDHAPDEDDDLFDLGKAYFDAHELDRCAWTLRDCRTGKQGFLRMYAKFLVSTTSDARRYA